MSGLEFTKEAAKQLEKTYLTRDVVAQRLETIRQLDLSSGESVLDIGCGPGYLCESIGEIVGRHGAVVGIDISTDLIALCNRRKASTWLSYAIGDATKVIRQMRRLTSLYVRKLPSTFLMLTAFFQKHFASSSLAAERSL